MNLGLALPQFPFSVPGDDPLRWESVVAWARHAERLGFASVFFSDHLVFSSEKYGGPAETVTSLEPMVALGGVIRATERISVGSLALCEPLRHPAVAAKQLATLERLGPGRLIVGLGAGWSDRDFEAAGVDKAPLGQRAQRVEESVAIMRAMWAGKGASHDGRWFQISSAVARPAPTTLPPIWICGGADHMVEVAAKVGDGWNAAWRWTTAGYRRKLTTFEAACERHGRDPGEVHRSLGLYALVGESEADLKLRYERLRSLAPPGVLRGTSLAEFRRDRLVGTVEEVREKLAGWGDLGVATIVVVLGGVPFTVTVSDDLDLLSSALPQE